MRQLPRACAMGITLLALLALAGCGKHYWGKAGASPEHFAGDSGECARENALYRDAAKEFGTVLQDQYKQCLRSRGWRRGQKLDPPPLVSRHRGRRDGAAQTVGIRASARDALSSPVLPRSTRLRSNASAVARLELEIP